MTELGPVVDNPTASRFELKVDGQVAVAEYQMAGTMIVFTHTEVPPALEGRGVGSALARGALDAARERGLTIFPLCPFMESYVRRHPEYLDLVNPSVRRRVE